MSANAQLEPTIFVGIFNAVENRGRHSVLERVGARPHFSGDRSGACALPGVPTVGGNLTRRRHQLFPLVDSLFWLRCAPVDSAQRSCAIGRGSMSISIHQAISFPLS